MQTKRLVLALLISSAILLAWSYFFPIKPPVQQKATPAVAQTPTPGNTPNAVPSPEPVKQSSPGSSTANASPQENPHRVVTVKTPLFEAKFDSKGAVAVSWIITKNKETNHAIYSAASARGKPVPLQLVSSEGLARQQSPLQLVTGDPATDEVLNSRNYSVEDMVPQGDLELDVGEGEHKRVSFSLRDATTGLEVVKTLAFDGGKYSTDLELSVKKAGATVPQVKLEIGPSIGDQGISHYTFYSVAPEAIGLVNGTVERHRAAQINENKKSPDHQVSPGSVDWAGIGDTYFAMVAIPQHQSDGVEFRTTAYDHPANGKPEKRYLTTAVIPVPADGSRTVLYVGPKDHYLLTTASALIGADVGRPIELEGLIDYGWFAWLSRPIAVRLLWFIRKLYELTSSYGLAIIIFTVIIYSFFFPLKWRSSKAMKKAQKLAPRMKELQEKIKGMKQNDPRLKELQMEQLRLMKEGNPLGGCLPLLIQMPFLFALYRAITISLDFRQATFLWLPDLSAGDPYHVLEILMAGTMIILQLITPAPSADPLQRKMMAIGMPLFMLYVLWGAPSGLLVYWLVGNVVGFSQQFLINRWATTAEEASAAQAS
jgi:YidC/Oxa1 family membrane protein insertase